MKKIMLLSFIFIHFVAADTGYFENRVLFCLDRDYPDLVIRYEGDEPRTDYVELNRLLEGHRIIKLEKWLSSAKEQDVVGEVDLRKVYRAHLETRRSWDELQLIIDEFSALDGVISADLEGRHELAAQTTPYTPSDTRYDEQWALTKIMADYAWGFWDTGTTMPGDSTILIGVVDTGVDYEHPDLENILYWNLGEDVNDDGVITAADENNIDDDGNGYIDDFRGWDFAGASSGSSADNDIRPPQAGPYQELSHGTHVAGIAAASTDNGMGVAGISFQSKVIATKNATDDDLETPGIYNGYDAILYCAQMGATIINCSWGGSFISSYERNILDNVSDNYGAIVVGACGNSNWDNDDFGHAHYPSDYSKCLSVAATTTVDAKASYSNWGSAIDISAPAGDGYNSATSTLSTIHYNAGEYASWPGTSMASPMVAGALALVNAYFPEAERQWLIDAVLAGADTIDHLNASYTGELGSGRLNVYRAIAMNLYPSLLVQNWDYTIIDDDGDGQLNPGEQAALNVTVLNEGGWLDAQNVTITLSSEHNGLSFPDPDATLGTINEGSTTSTGMNDLVFAVDEEANLQELPITILITANQMTEHPYETSEIITVTPSLYQEGFPYPGLVVSVPVGIDSLLDDGDLELIIVAENDSLYLINADGSIVDGFPVFLEGATSMAPVIADMDADGFKEIVIINRGGFLKIFERDGTELLSQDFDETYRGDAAVGNLDADAELEIVFGTYSRLLHAVNIDGTELPGFPLSYDERIREGVSICDLSGDETPEIVFASDEFLHVITTDGSELTNFPVTLADRVNTAPVVAQIDDTYHIIVGMINETVQSISMDGTVEASYTAAADLNSAPALCDINQDDLLEIVFGTNDGMLHAIGMGGNLLDNFPIPLEGAINTSPVFADFNGDDTLEIVITTETGNIVALNHEGHMFRNFPATFAGNVDGSPAVADIDNDGDFEVVAGSNAGVLVLDVSGDAKGAGLWNTYLAKNYRNGYYLFDPVQSALQTGIIAPLEYEIGQNFPNPFNPVTTIRYTLKEPGRVDISIFSTTGAKVYRLVNRQQAAGRYEVQWNSTTASGQQVSSGVYIYRITTGSFSDTRKMILVR